MVAPGLPVSRVYRGKTAGRVPATAARHPQRFEIPRGNDVLRLRTSSELINDVEGGGVNYIDPVSPDLGHVHPLQSAADGRTEMPRSSLTINIARIKNGGHAVHGRNSGGGFFFSRLSRSRERRQHQNDCNRA